MIRVKEREHGILGEGDGFAYVDVALGGVNRRNNVVRLNEYEPNGRADCYRTFLRFPLEYKEHAENKLRETGKPSVAGYKGLALADYLPFDFDCAEDSGRALQDARVLVHRLEEDYGVLPEALRCYFSGSKGFAIEVPAELFGGFEPNARIAAYLKHVACILAGDLETFDDSIYKINGLWRIPNTRHGVSGLYKIGVTADELLTESVEVIKKWALEPRPELRYPDPAQLELVPALRELYEGARQAPKKQESGTMGGERLNTEAVLAGVLEGERDVSIFRLACKLRRADVPQSVAESLALDVAAKCDPPFPHDEALKKVSNAYARYHPESSIEPEMLDSLERTSIMQEDSEQQRAHKSIFTATELLAIDFPEPKWAVPGIVPEGVTLLGGKPKMGKSWLALGLCIAVATGGYAFGKKRVEQGTCLYLALEDNNRRLQTRLRKLLRVETSLDRLHIATEWSPLDKGGDVELRAWLEGHPDTRLVVIDTLKKVRPKTSGQRNVYDVDYEALEPLLPLAAQHGLAIIVVHHLRQMPAADPLDEISGSTGLTGVVDGVLVLKRDRGEADACLYATGRDIEEEMELALQWDPNLASWTLLGDAEEYRLSPERREIRELLASSAEPMGPKEIAESLRKSEGAVKMLLSEMLEDGQVERPYYGKYTVPYSPYSADSPRSNDPLLEELRVSGQDAEAYPSGPAKPANTSRVSEVSGVSGNKLTGYNLLSAKRTTDYESILTEEVRNLMVEDDTDGERA